MGNYASYYLGLDDFGSNDQIKDLEYEVAHLKNGIEILNIQQKILKLEKDELTHRYQNAIEESVSMFEETVVLKKEIEELKNSPPPAGHTNYSWREILGKKPKN